MTATRTGHPTQRVNSQGELSAANPAMPPALHVHTGHSPLLAPQDVPRTPSEKAWPLKALRGLGAQPPPASGTGDQP